MNDETLMSKNINDQMNSQDRLQNMIVASLNILGPLGSALSSSISMYLTSQRLKYLQNVVDEMAQRLNKIRTDDLEKILCSDE